MAAPGAWLTAAVPTSLPRLTSNTQQGHLLSSPALAPASSACPVHTGRPHGCRRSLCRGCWMEGKPRIRPGPGALDSSDGRQFKERRSVGGPIFTRRLWSGFPVRPERESDPRPLRLSSLLPDTQPSCWASAPPLLWTAPGADVRLRGGASEHTIFKSARCSTLGNTSQMLLHSSLHCLK